MNRSDPAIASAVLSFIWRQRSGAEFCTYGGAETSSTSMPRSSMSASRWSRSDMLSRMFAAGPNPPRRFASSGSVAGM